MSQANKGLVVRWFEEVWNKRDLSAIPRMFHMSGKAHGFPEPGAVSQGPEEFARHAKAFQDGFGDLHVSVDDLIAEGDKVAVRWTATMTHTGDGLGIPATFKKVCVPGSSFLICGNDQILEGWNYADFTQMRLQLEGKL